MTTLLLCVLLAGSPALGGEVLLAQQEKKVLMNFDSTRLVEVVKWMSKTTGRNYIVPENLRKRTLTVLSSTPVSLMEAQQAFQRALAAEGLEMVQEEKFALIRAIGAAAARDERPPAACVPEKSVIPDGENRFRIQRKALEGVFADATCLAMQARIVPNFTDGKPSGFKLFAIRPGSLYSQMGIQNGDVVRRINDFEMNGPEQALEAYTKLKTATSWVVEILRRGEPLKLTYSID